MIDILNKNYDKMGQDTFAKLAPFICWLTDGLVIYYVHTTLIHKYVTPKAIILAYQLRTGGDTLDYNFASEMTELMKDQVMFMLICFFILHTVIYILAMLKKEFAIKYMKFYSFSGLALSFLTTALLLVGSFTINWIFLICTISFAFILLGYVRLFKN